MTRNEQIKEAANQYAEHFPRAKNASFVSFTAGVEWSEQNQGSVDWPQVRIQAAIAAMQGLCNSCHDSVIREIQESSDKERSNVISFLAVRIADALVKELKGE